MASAMGGEKPVWGPVRPARSSLRDTLYVSRPGDGRKIRQLEEGALGRSNSHLAGLLMFTFCKRSRAPPLLRTNATG